MTIPPVSGYEIYAKQDGSLTFAGQQLLQEMVKAIEAQGALLEAIAAVADPTGGATVDAEARTAIIAIIDGAAP